MITVLSKGLNVDWRKLDLREMSAFSERIAAEIEGLGFVENCLTFQAERSRPSLVRSTLKELGVFWTEWDTNSRHFSDYFPVKTQKHQQSLAQRLAYEIDRNTPACPENDIVCFLSLRDDLDVWGTTVTLRTASDVDLFTDTIGQTQDSSRFFMFVKSRTTPKWLFDFRMPSCLKGEITLDFEWDITGVCGSQ